MRLYDEEQQLLEEGHDDLALGCVWFCALIISVVGGLVALSWWH